MGKRGPAPKPTNLRVLHGDPPGLINHNEPQPGPGLPEPPEGMSKAARDIWDYVVKELGVMNLAHRPDREQLAAYCEAVRLHSAASAATAAAGPLIRDRETVRVNPAVRVQTQAARTMLLFAREFGLTPASRVQFTAEQIGDAFADAERLLS